MNRVVNWIPRSDVDAKIPPLNLVANTTTDVLPDTIQKDAEYVFINIFNNGPANVYYAYGVDCNKLGQFCAYLVPGQMLDVPVRERVSCFADGNVAKLSFTVIKRNDLIQNQ